MQIPFDKRLSEITDIPHTISFIIRKRLQIDNLNELSKDKRPPDRIIWEGSSEDLEEFLDRVLYKNEPSHFDFVINDSEIER